MSGSLFSSSWYRVAELRLKLRPHVRLERHVLRGRRWYVVQDRQTGRFYRLSPAAHLVVCLMDGRRSLGAIWEIVARRFGSAQPTQDETIQLLAQLYRADLLIGSVEPDAIELFRRGARQEQRELMLRLRNPLVLRLPVFDPDKFLNRTIRFVRPVFSPLGFALWLLLVGIGIVLAVLHWSELNADLADRLFSASTLALLFFAYPAVKALHELGHAYATKAWGGEVHEIGIMMLALFPVPYVDATAASGFPDKWRRALVGAAGIMVELVLAVMALIVWIAAAPGFVRALAFSVMLIGGISTVLFNGNPLLRFDGYYVLSDVLEIPNLAARASNYVLYLLRRYGFGSDEPETFAETGRERFWLLTYAVASFCYRMTITLGLALFFTTKFFFIGVLLALWSVGSLIGWPIAKGIHYLFRAPRLRPVRRRALAVATLLVALPAALLLLVPLPYATVVQGVVQVPEHAVVRATADGFVAQVLAEPESRVTIGQKLVVLADPQAEASLTVLEAQQREFQARLEAVDLGDLVQAKLLREQIKRIDASAALARRKLADMTIRSANTGTFVLIDGPQLPGRLVHRGDLLGYVVNAADPQVEVAVSQADIALMRDRLQSVAMRYAHDVAHPMLAHVTRETPAAQRELPSAALGMRSGGEILADPNDPSGRSAFEQVFLIDVSPLAGPPLAGIGERAFVRFEHEPEPLAGRLFRRVRQVFLKYLYV
ncbi:MAG TPA: PqqD family peptide modification chaperone [Stellaceae bacterium]|nr:PqqD family peptide modification chaperone [Stellaceae bacterium]